MTDSFRVRVVEFGDRAHYQLQWTCPLTGRKKTKSSGVERTGRKKELDAVRDAAAELKRKLVESDYQPPSRITWDDFRTRFEREVAAQQSAETAKKVGTTFDLVERMIRPTRLADLTSAAVSGWLADLQTTRAPATAGMYGRTLRAALNWAKSMGLLAKPPTFRIPRKAQGESMAKGRAICGEEHDRIKAAVGKIVKADHVAAWLDLLDGLWWSGLRIGEALRLSWDSSADVTAIVVPGKRPVVRFKAAGQKARRDEIWPCPPEFATMLEKIPEAERVGLVFKVPKLCSGRWPGPMTVDCAGRIVAKITKKAGVLIDEKQHANAHDYRRAFGTRWSKRVMPAVLQRLMRHREIGTTLAYYVEQDAAKIADELWAQFGNTFGNSAPETSEKQAAKA